MARAPFDPLKTAAMRSANPRRVFAGPDSLPLLPHEERAVIEAAALSEAVQGELAAEEGGSVSHPLSVSQINAMLKGVLEAVLPPAFFVQGEISNFRTYDRGHAFFTLKDASAELPCVLWKETLGRLKFKPKDGLAVIARGAVKLYEAQGKLQLYVESLYPQGAGALELAFRQLCEKLRAEGLFEPARKRPITRLPQTVVIITSRTGDVLHDVLTTAFRRFPGLHAMLHPVRVQGAQAAPDIIRAIEQVNAYHKKRVSAGQSGIDLILLVRGGGSLEDLWAFNEESVARAIVASRIPIATGIGHEPDTTIADLVGDLRGPTPTGITELTIPDVRALLAELSGKAALLTRDLRHQLASAENDLERAHIHLRTAATEVLRNRELRIDLLCKQIERIEPRHAIAQGWRRVEESQRRLEKAIHARVQGETESLNRCAYRLERCSPRTAVTRHHDHIAHLQIRLSGSIQTRLSAALQKLSAAATQLRVISPQAVLERGFSITTDKDGQILRAPEQVQRGDLLTTRLVGGTLHSTVGKPRQGSLF
jgi:exodeoxyribonuclease VII large subunit